MRILLLAALLAAAPFPAVAQDDPETAYLRLHRATLAHNLQEMILYASEERKSELIAFAGDPIRLKLVSSMMPRVYTVRSLARSPDGTRVRIRATGTFTFMGSTAPSFGVIDVVREPAGWKVDRFEWTGDKPPGFDAAVAQAPVRRGAAEKVPPTQEAPKPPPEVASIPVPPPAVEKPPAAKAPAVASPAPGTIERSRPRAPCEIKPVMTDEDLENCGASPR